MTRADPLRVKLHIDGGARGNPGPAAAGVVIRTADDGTVIYQAGIFLGHSTNNVAEYTALVAGLEAAGRLKADEVEALSDSELLVRQMTGQYRVRNSGLKPLYERARQLAGEFRGFSISHVRREENLQADGMVNQALKCRRNVEDACH